MISKTLLQAPERFPRVSEICACITAGIALLSLLGWVSGMRFLAGQLGTYLPMAPSTALAFLLVSGVLFSIAHLRLFHLGRLFELTAVSIVLLIGLFVLVQLIFGINFGVEQVLFRTNELMGSIPMGRMSPLTAIVFLLEGAALLILLIGGRGRNVSSAVALLAAAATAINTVVLIGYVFGAPLLYGGTTIPVALPTAIAFVSIGLGQLNLAVPGVPAFREWSGASMRGILLRAFLPFLLFFIFLDSWADLAFAPITKLNPAVWYSLKALAAGTLIVITIAWIARRTGAEIERTQKALTESEARYRSLFENMLSGYAHCQMLFEDGKPQDFIYLDVNEAFEKLTGLKDVTGKKVSEVIPGVQESNPELFEIYGRVALTGQSERFKTQIPSLGIWFSISVYSSEPGLFVVVFDNITEHKQAEQTTAWLASFPELNPNPIVEIDSTGAVSYMNPAARHMFPDLPTQGFKHPWLAGLEGVIGRFQQEGISELEREIQIGADWYSQPLYYVLETARLRIYGSEITERRQAEQQTVQMKRLYATLSQVNQAIVRVKSPAELYQTICDVAVKFGEFSLAWICLLDEATGDLRPVAAHGFEVAQWPFPVVNVRSGPMSKGLMATAIRTARVMISDDLQTDQRAVRLQEQTQEYDFHSAAAVPFQMRGKTIGVLGLISHERDFFDAQQEVHLLEEMGLDISYALDMMETEAERTQAEQQTVQMKRLYATLSQVNQAIVRVKSQDELFQSICDVAVQFGEFVLAWVGLLNESTGNVRPVAAYGLDVKQWPFQLVNVQAGPVVDGLIASAIQTSRVVTSDDLQDDDALQSVHPLFEKYGYRASAGVPLQLRGQTIGVLNLVSSEAGFFKDQAEIHLLEEMGLDISYALDRMETEVERKRAEEEIQARSQQLAALLEVGQTLTESLERAQVLQKITDQGAALLGVETSATYLVEGDHLYLGASTPPLPPEFPETLRRANLADHPHIAKVLVTRQPVILPDTTSALLTAQERGVCDAMGLRTILYVPLEVKKDMIGVLILSTTAQPREFSENEIAMARAFSNQAALAIANAGLYDDLSLYVKELEHQITERKQAEQTLSESEERLRLSLQAANQGLYDLNVQNGDAVVNRQYAEMLGYDFETFVETNAAWIERLHPDDRERVAKTYVDYTSGLLPEYRVEFRQKTRDGNWKWILSLGKVTADSHGQPLRMLGTHTDITERKQAEERLILSESRYRRLFESAKDGILILDVETGIITDANPFLITLLGYSREDLLGKRIWELGFFKDIFANKANFQELQQMGYIRYDDLPLETAYGRRINVEFVSNVYDVDYQKVIQCNIRDITERKQAEKALQESEERFSKAFYQSPIGVLLVDLTDATIRDVNEALLEMAALQREELVGQSVTRLNLKIDPEVTSAITQELMEHGTFRNREVQLQRADGQMRYVLNSGALVTIGGRPHNLALIQDITERKQAEAVLRDSEERFRMLFESNPAIMLLIEPVSGAIKDANRAAAEFYGYSPAELRSMNINQVNQLSAEEVYAERMRALKQDRNFFIFEHRLAGGEMRSVEVHSSPMQLDGNPVLFSIVYDITSRKKVEGELQDMQNRMSGIVESAIDAIISVDINQQIVLANSAAEHMFGYEEGELIGKPLDVLIPERFRKGHPHHVQQFGETGIITRSMNALGAIHGLRASGEEFPAEASISQISIGADKMYTVILRDITERRQSEAQIQRQLKHLNGLRMIDIAISSSFDLSLTLDVVLQEAHSQLGVDACAILFLNTQMQTIEYAASRGFRSEAFHHTQLKLREGYAGQAVLKRATIHISDSMELGGKLSTALPLERESFVDYYGTPLIVKGEVIGALEIYHRSHLKVDSDWLEFLETLSGQAAIAIDNAQMFESLQRSNANLERRVTERTAELNRANVELEHANRTKDEFLANMSHELRTPLTSILGLSESLLEQQRDPLTGYQERSIQVIESSGRHLLELINDILDLSKIEAGKFDFYPQPISVDEICRSSLSFIKSQATKRSIQITYTNEASVSQIYADPRRLKQILVNLLSNAVKFTRERGNVTLHVTGELTQDLIQFSVIDNGIGISDQDLKRLFQPFVQVDSSLNRQHEGTGLGLALVQRLTDLHGGSVQVESEVGKGSRFTVSLACQMGEIARLEALKSQTLSAGRKPAEKTEADSKDPERRKLVLLAEDNMANVLTMGEYLKSHDYEVVVAHDGLEAIKVAETINPDIILMDIQMPVMNGLDAIARLRDEARFASTPIVALTALAMSGDRERCLAAGANEYMSKPVSLKLLAETIHDLLERQNP